MSDLVLTNLAALAIWISSPSQVPQIERPVVTGDWITGCTQSLNCAAYSLREAGGSSPVDSADLSIQLERDYVPGSLIQLDFRLVNRAPAAAPPRRLWIDGAPLSPSAEDWRGLQLHIEGSQASDLVRRMQSGRRLTVTDDVGTILANASLLGLRGALKRMDTEQGRAGTVEGVALPGAPSADWAGGRVAPLSPGWPIRTMARDEIEGGSGITPTASALETIKPDAPCVYLPWHRVERLDPITSLLLVYPNCDLPGLETMVALVGEDGELVPVPFEPYRLDGQLISVAPGPSGEVRFPEARWDVADGLLVITRNDRPTADCGEQWKYAWDVEARTFRLASYSSMPVCRGNRDFMPTWQAERVAVSAANLRLDGIDCRPDDLDGLDWALCNVPELRTRVLDIQAAQRARHDMLGRRDQEALAIDWRRFLAVLRAQIGGRWLDVAAGDVGSELRARRDFVERIEPRPDDEGRWANYRAEIQISSANGNPELLADAPGCSITVPVTEARADRRDETLSVRLDRASFYRRYPSLGGCFLRDGLPSVIDGIYFPQSDH